MVAEEHFCVRHIHNALQNLYPAESSVDDVAEDIQPVIGLEIDLFENSLEAVEMTVNVRNNVSESHKVLLSQCLFLP